MKLLQIFLQVAVIYAFFLAGRWLQMIFELKVPGSIIGMILFFILLLTGIFPRKWFEKGSEILITNMPFMFLPVTVGVLNYVSFFQGNGLLLIAVVLISTAIVLISSAYIGQTIVERKGRQQ